MNAEKKRIGRSETGGLRGWLYFCEDRLQYVRGPRAWIFFAPYLLGAVLLDPQVRTKDHESAPLIAWAIFLVYLVAFPPVWQALFARLERWNKRRKAPGMADFAEPE
jgi:hypothetical protein